MLRISVEGQAQVARAIRRVAAQSPVVAARALNYTGRAVRHALQSRIPQVFDRPTPFTVRGLRSTTATPQRLYTDIGFKDISITRRGHYLEPQVYGGARPVKRLEALLSAKGILPRGMFVVPGPAAKLDRYGNWSRGEIVQIISALGAAFDPLTNTDLTRTRGTRRGVRPTQRRRRLYWAGRPGNGRLPPGIWAIGETHGRSDRLRPVAWFTRQPRYRKRWDMHREARAVAVREVGPAVKLAWEKTITQSGGLS